MERIPTYVLLYCAVIKQVDEPLINACAILVNDRMKRERFSEGKSPTDQECADDIRRQATRR